MVWDARGSKFLLNFKTRCLSGDFSPDGRFLAYGTSDRVFIWKESPTGYALHQELTLASARRATPLLSLYGESIIAYHWPTVRLWHTTASPPSIPNAPVRRGNFILGFSTDQTLAVVARTYGNTITIFDLQSGEPWFTIDAGMGVLGMRMTRSAVIVVGDGVVTWDLPTGDRALNAKANTEDTAQTTPLDPIKRPPLSPSTAPASISPDLIHVAVHDGSPIALYDISTGKHLASAKKTGSATGISTPWFTPDTHEVWCGGRKHSHGWTIVEGDGPGVVKLDPVDPGASPSGGFPWESSHGYEVLDDEWVPNPGRKRLLWLPHNWKSDGDWSWGGRFLGLFHGALPEAVILEFYE